MRGFYFVNTDISNSRAHTAQILQTSFFVNQLLPLFVVAPRYGESPGGDVLGGSHGLPKAPPTRLLFNFWIKSPGLLAFALFNLSAIFFLFKELFRPSAFIYVRSSLFLPLVFFAWIIGVPCFYETHRRPITLSERFRDFFLARMSRGIIVISHHLRSYYEFYKKPILVVHDAVDLERFAIDLDKDQARLRAGLSDGPICLYSGTASLLKGVNYILDCAKLLPEVSFVLLGRVSQEFKSVKLPPNVTLLGERGQEEVPVFLKAADVLLLPHPKGEYSQSPMKLFEYMASGVPIVGSRLPSLEEILNEENSFLVEPENAGAMASAIREALQNKAGALKKALKAKEEVKNYTWEKRGETIASFIKTNI